ncbi:hypothetical protein ACFXGO_29060, partial [Streptomyces roseus]|uniref:hypothetical protein n=1 Tax=Streptomyces roseus TaxID=66430 RepID=UPI0036C474A1
GYLSAARSGETGLAALGQGAFGALLLRFAPEERSASLRSAGLGCAEPELALLAGVLRFAPDRFGTSLRSVPNGPLRGPG